MTLLVLQVIEATLPWTGVSASSAKKTPARNSCVLQTAGADRFKGAGYKTVTEALQAFNDLVCLLEDVNLTRIMVTKR